MSRPKTLLASTAPLAFTAADYQEAKHNENVRGILPNTRKLQRAFNVP